MGLSLETLPIVLQYNKRDLPDVVPVDEMNRAMNPRAWPHFEASAVTGQGVFETLKGISKLTLLNLKKRLTKMTTDAPRPGAGAGARPAGAYPTGVPRPVSTAPVAAPPPAAQPPRPTPPAPAARAATPAPKAKTSHLDVLAELEKIRKQALTGAPGAAPAAPASPPPPARSTLPPPRAISNGKGEIHRSVELTMKRSEFRRARRFLLNLRVEDGDQRVMDAIRDLPIEITDIAQLEKVLLQLNVALKPKD
jgi:hypothetical protein